MILGARVSAIAAHLPRRKVDNAELARRFPEWTAEKIEAKTGIINRRIADPGECASDLAAAAAERLFAYIDRRSVDYLIFCSQAPDSPLPSTACLLQHRLSLRTSCGAVDIALGCSGFVYGLGLAQGLLSSGQARRVLLLTADTYSRYIDDADRGLRVLFGDGAAATLVEADQDVRAWPFVYGTDGSGARDLIVEAGGARIAASEANPPRLVMDGPAILSFTLAAVPRAIYDILEAARLALADIDLFVFHQANAFMLEHLREHLGIPSDRFIVHLRDCGNTVSASIPLALAAAARAGAVRASMKVMLVGFGVGLSWGVTIITWGDGVIALPPEDMP